jgi:hypothetical protein
LQALVVLFWMVIETKFLDMQEQKVFFRMRQPNINVRRVSMIRLTETTSSKSLTNTILCNTSKALAQVPNPDSQISVLPYQITAEGTSETRAQLFSNMRFTFDRTYKKNVKVKQWAEAITDDNITGFLKLFKIECDTLDTIKAILIYLQKYKTLYSKEDWIAMGNDVEFEEDMESKYISELQRVLVKWIQEKRPLDSWPPTEPIVLPMPFTMVKLGRRSMKPGKWDRKDNEPFVVKPYIHPEDSQGQYSLPGYQHHSTLPKTNFFDKGNHSRP